MAERADVPSYRGTRGLDVPLTHPSRQLRLLALDAWDDLFVLRGIEAPATTMPFPGHGWTLETDQGTTHHSAGGGVGGGERIWQWEIDFDSPLPDEVGYITVSPGLVDGQPAPATTLAVSPTSIARPATTFNVGDDRRSAACAFCNPVPRAEASAPSGPRCPACWAAQHGLDRAVRESDTVRPRLVPVSADLGDLAGARIAVCSLTAWRTWFDITLGAQGAGLAGRRGPHLAGRWDVEDDRGNHYTGITTSGFSGISLFARAACAPALDPHARALTTTFPDPFGDAGIITTTVALPRDQ